MAHFEKKWFLIPNRQARGQSPNVNILKHNFLCIFNKFHNWKLIYLIKFEKLLFQFCFLTFFCPTKMHFSNSSHKIHTIHSSNYLKYSLYIDSHVLEMIFSTNKVQINFSSPYTIILPKSVFVPKKSVPKILSPIFVKYFKNQFMNVIFSV